MAVLITTTTNQTTHTFLNLPTKLGSACLTQTARLVWEPGVNRVPEATNNAT